MESGSPPVRWGRIFAILLVFFLVFEAIVQVFLYRWAGKRYQSLSPYVWSPYGLVRNNPKLTSTAFQISENGFRNLRSFTRKKPPRTLRVFILGGSVMYSGLGGNTIEGVQRVDSSSTTAQYLEEILRQDPELADLNIEVMNAAINFNRIVEVSSGYINEYAFWEPDVVIVGGTGNNFCYAPPAGLIPERGWIIEAPHGWEVEFQRIANERSFLSFAEKGITVVESYSAGAAVTRKGLTQGMDLSFTMADSRARSLGILEVRPDPQPPSAPFSEYDAYIKEYLGYASAMAAVARVHDAEMAFFWEYLLGSLGGVKPMSEIEKVLYKQNRRATYEADRRYDLYARDKVGEFCQKNSLTFLDPLERLKTHDGTVYIDYIHYTREGNRFMAGFMYDAMKDIFHKRAARLRGGAAAVTP